MCGSLDMMQVPRESGELACLPVWEHAPRAVARNRRAKPPHEAAAELNIQGRPLPRLQAEARAILLQAARQYTAELDASCADAGSSLERDALPGGSWEVSRDDTEKPLIVEGHQPALFHPGVWAKNFAAGGLARRCGGQALHLLVDQDVAPAFGIRVPAGSADHPESLFVPFDEARQPQPWEGAEICSPALWNSFAARAAERLRAWKPQISRPDEMEAAAAGLERFWRRAVAHRAVSPRIVDGLAAARRQREREWGLSNVELPMSRLSETEPFLWFACQILVDVGRFQQAHNDALAGYRRAHKLRGTQHPVPPLQQTADGCREGPFWIWRRGDARRQRLFVRQERRELLVYAGTESPPLAALPLHPEVDACCAVKVWKQLTADGWCLRTRALTTTLFVRLFVADLFIHGIGGAKYDAITDELFRGFYGIAPPEFMTVTGTFRLPLDPHPVQESDLRRLERDARDLEWNPERFARSVPELGATAAALQRVLLAPADGNADLRTRHDRIRTLKRELAASLAERRDDLRRAIAGVRQQLTANRILNSREWAFCLYPESVLRPALTRFLA